MKTAIILNFDAPLSEEQILQVAKDAGKESGVEFVMTPPDDNPALHIFRNRALTQLHESQKAHGWEWDDVIVNLPKTGSRTPVFWTIVNIEANTLYGVPAIEWELGTNRANIVGLMHRNAR